MSQSSPAPRRVVFQYLVPVHVEVEDGLVACVTVIDETPVRDPTIVEGDPAYLGEAVRHIPARLPGSPSGRAGVRSRPCRRPRP